MQEAQEAHVGARQTASSAEVETPEGLRRELDEIAEKLPEVATLSVVANMAQVWRFGNQWHKTWVPRQGAATPHHCVAYTGRWDQFCRL